MNRRGQSMGLEEFVRLAFSVALAILLIGGIVSIYIWWSAPALKEEATAKNVLDNLVNVVNAQEGDAWTVKTFVNLQTDFYMIGFSATQSKYSGIPKPVSCAGSCVCIFKRVDNNPKVLVCENINPKILQGEEYVASQDCVGGPYSTCSNQEFAGFNRNKGEIGDGFFISKDSGCQLYKLEHSNVLSVVPAC